VTLTVGDEIAANDKPTVAQTNKHNLMRDFLGI
jgi:hypothetical protein